VLAADKRVTALLLALGAGFLFGLGELYKLRFESGDIYPPYSSLRADPLGTKALYESLARIDGMSVSRHYRDVVSLPRGAAAIFFLGANPRTFQQLGESELKHYEDLASSGAHIVVAMRPVNPARSEKGIEGSEPPTTELEKRWSVRFRYLEVQNKVEDDAAGSMPRVTALYFVVDGKPVHRWEKRFGAGSILMLPSAYPFSNEALAFGRDSAFLAETLGSNRRVFFDEYHLGISESENVVSLGRKYRLEPLAAVLLAVFGLFVWKSSSSLLPPLPDTMDRVVDVGDAGSGLANLLRRNVSQKSLMPMCLEQWERSHYGGKFYSQSKIARAKIAARSDNAAEAYRRVSRILSDRSEG